MRTCLSSRVYGYTDAELEAKSVAEELVGVIDLPVEGIPVAEASPEEYRIRVHDEDSALRKSETHHE